MDTSALHVLIVDDDRDLCVMLSKLLSSHGYQTTYVLSGDECLRRVPTEPFDLIVLDIMMPGLDGYEVCRRLKMQRETNQIPILMLSARDTDRDKVVGLQTGADAYVSKPFEIDVLMSEIAEVLERQHRLMSEKGFRGRITFRMASQFRYIEEVNELIGQLFKHTDLASNEIWELKLALHELGINAIEHGNKMDPDKSVSITYTLFDDRIAFEIRDEGEGFSVDEVPNPTCSEGLVRERGRGIYLVSQVVDQIEYVDGGATACLTKFFKKRHRNGNNH